MVFFIVVFCLFSSYNGVSTPGQEDLVNIIGLDIKAVSNNYGAPQEVFPVRGEQAWHDDVVFYYSNHMYLYLYQNRVWQLRFDERYKDSFFNLKMGASKGEVIKVFGKPLAEVNGTYIYNLTDIGYPIRIRVAFKDEKLNDLYLYRGDF